MKPLPRINGPIFGTGHNFTPDEFPRAWNATMDELEAEGNGNSSSGASGFDVALWGCGRVAGNDFFTGDSAKAALPPSPALALLLPAAVYYVADAQGAMHRFDAQARTVVNVPPLLDEQLGFLRAVEVEDGDGVWTVELFGWTAAPDETLRAQGFPCVGRVSSDTDSVTSVSSDESSVIWPQPLLQSVLRTLIGGGGTGTTGGASVLAATQLPITLTDVTDTKTYIDAKNADQDAQIALLGGAADVFPAPFDVLANEIAINRLGLGEINPPAIERGQISVVGANFGLGQNDTPDFSPTTGALTEMPFDEATGVFGT